MYTRTTLDRLESAIATITLSTVLATPVGICAVKLAALWLL